MNIRSAVLERLNARLSCSNKLSAQGGPANCASVQSRLKLLKLKITWSKSAEGVVLCCVLCCVVLCCALCCALCVVLCVVLCGVLCCAL